MKTFKCTECDGYMQSMFVNFDEGNQEIYRKRVCDKCGRVAFSIEYEVDTNDDVLKKWEHLEALRNKFRSERYRGRYREYTRQYAAKNRERLNAYQREWRKKKKERMRESIEAMKEKENA